MARKREGTVQEPLARLRALEKENASGPAAQRLMMLRLLKERPDRPVEEIASMIGCSTRTIKRWWKVYQEEGLDAFVELPSGNSDTHRASDELAELKQKLLNNELGSIAEVRRWLGEEMEDADTIAPALPEPRGGKQRGITPPSPFQWAILLRLLGELPALELIIQKSEAIRDAIQDMFRDVDRVTLSINGGCPIIDYENYEPTIFIAQNGPANESPNPISVGRGDESHEERTLRILGSLNFEFELYHAPHTIVYDYRGSAYLGVLQLWTNRNREPLSAETIDMMNVLEPVWHFIFAGVALDHQARNPIDQVFNKALSKLVKEFKLSAQEHRVLVFRLLGYPYKETASLLNISIDTIRHHLKSIYAKTGTGSLAELFARHFTPKGDIDK